MTSTGLLLSLTVSQSIQQPEVLLLFLFLFGGRVYSNRQQTGTRHALLMWKVTGLVASRAAQLLCEVDGLGKAAQLRNAVEALQTTSLEERGILCSPATPEEGGAAPDVDFQLVWLFRLL